MIMGLRDSLMVVCNIQFGHVYLDGQVCNIDSRLFTVYALTDGLAVSASFPTTHRPFAISSTHLMPSLGQLGTLSFTTESQGHSRWLRPASLLTEGCSLAFVIRSSSDAYDVGP